MERVLAALVLFLFASVPGWTQNAPDKKKPKQAVNVDQASIDAAIQKGLAYLKTSDSPDSHTGGSDELKLLTMLHGGLTESDPVVAGLVKKILDTPLEKTYPVALTAMCLEEVDRVKYQHRIAQCGQFLLDNVKPNGGFGYGEPSAYTMNVPTGGRKAIASGGAKPRPAGEIAAPGEKQKPRVENTIKLSKKKEGPEARSDSSNCQYAALGFRACHDAGIVFPKEILERCRKYWEGSQHAGDKARDNSVASGGIPMGTPRGWCYNDGQGLNECGHGGQPYSSMTAGAVGAVCIYDYMLGKDWKRDRVVLDGLAWLEKNWSVTENVGPPETSGGNTNGWLYYYLYALERTGMLFDTSLIGNKDWYFEGAKVLLNAQRPDGSWDASHFKKPTWDTCFAVLFLERATRRLTASESGARK